MVASWQWEADALVGGAVRVDMNLGPRGGVRVMYMVCDALYAVGWGRHLRAVQAVPIEN